MWVLGNVSLVEDDEGNLSVIEGIWMDITERKLSEEELKSSRELLRALSAELQVIREKERTHIAREIHDQLGQALTRLKIDLSLMADDLPADRRHLLKKTASMSNLLDEAIQSVRRICSQLRPSALDHLGLTAAIEEELSGWHDRTGIEYDFVSCPQDLILDLDRSTAVFRILQEALTNVARHTNATRVDIRLSNKGGYVNLIISDNGRGIQEEEVYNPKSLGLIGMRERALQWYLAFSGISNAAGFDLVGMMIRVLIVDDNADVREGLKRILEKASDIAVGAEATNGQEALDRIEGQEWDVVLLDVSLPDLSGLEVLRRIKSQRPDLSVLMVSVHSEELYAAPALRAGASGYLPKDRAAEHLAIAIRKVSTGCLYFSPSIAERFQIESGPAGSQTEGTFS